MPLLVPALPALPKAVCRLFESQAWGIRFNLLKSPHINLEISNIEGMAMIPPGSSRRERFSASLSRFGIKDVKNTPIAFLGRVEIDPFPLGSNGVGNGALECPRCCGGK